MRRFADSAQLFLEFARYLCTANARPFDEVLLERIGRGAVSPQSRPYLLSFVVVSALNARGYSHALRALEEYPSEMPWDALSTKLLRRIFEISMINDRLSVARRALNQLSARKTGEPPRAVDIEPLRQLFSWCSGDMTDASTIDLNRTYFVAFPAYDPYFKGLIASSLKRYSEARRYFRESLALAPEHALGLRDDAARRLNEGMNGDTA